MNKKRANLEKYELLEEIGRGTFSNVYKALRKENREIVALKQIKKQINQKDLMLVQNEIDILKNVDSPNIIKFFGDFKEKGKWYLAFQYCPHGDLHHLLKKQGILQQETVQMISYCISSALETLHKSKIVHRDLKLANILINQNSQIKLADFGFSKNSEQQLMQTYCGTPITMAPEILQRKGYGENCDTWSLGIITYQMIFGIPPFMPKQGKGFQELVQMVINKKLQFLKDIEITQGCKSFLSKCLIKDPSKRPLISELLSDPWIIQGRQRLQNQKHIFKREGEHQLSTSPVFSTQSSCEQKIDSKQEVESALRYLIEEHYQIILKKLCLNNLKGVYKKCAEVLNEENLKILPFVFLKKIKYLSQMQIKVNLLDRFVTVPLKQYLNYTKIQTIMVDWLKQIVPQQYSQKQINLQKLISFNIYDCLIELISCQHPQKQIKEKLQTIQFLVNLIDTPIGDGESTLMINNNIDGVIKKQITQYMSQIDNRNIIGILNKHHKDIIKKQQVNKIFVYSHKHYNIKQKGSQFQELQYVKDILNRRIKRTELN